MPHTHDELRALLNAQTGKVTWPELERHFARGVVVKVAPELDLVEVAACLVEDDRGALNRWAATAQVGPATMDDAKRWLEGGAVLWAVVTAPWVLVQEPAGPGH